MFSARELAAEVRAVRTDHAPDALVLDCERDFETLTGPPLDDLATRVDSVDPLSYPDEWVPADAPAVLHRLAGTDLVVGYPEHGSVTWTRQTEPPVVLVRARARGSPAAFVSFLVAEALVEVGAERPEHFLGFFEGRYPRLSRLGLAPNATYQVAAALYDAYVGRSTRADFAGWSEDRPDLHAAWLDAGKRLEPRLGELGGAVARGEVSFADACELALSGVKHDLDIPPPFDALDTAAYGEHGADFAVEWAERVIETVE